jgi:hypothetical protein
MRIAFATFIALLPTISAAGPDSSSKCGEAPIVADESFKASSEGKASLLRGLIGQADLATHVEKAKTDVFVKYPNADRTRKEMYFGYVICTQLLNDARISVMEKAEIAVALLPQIQPLRN